MCGHTSALGCCSRWKRAGKVVRLEPRKWGCLPTGTSRRVRWSGNPPFKQAFKLVKLHLLVTGQTGSRGCVCKNSTCSVAVGGSPCWSGGESAGAEGMRLEGDVSAKSTGPSNTRQETRTCL